jgi:drug/metabolite transporter (DMT)-like permease
VTIPAAVFGVRSLPDGIRWGVGLAFVTALISGASIFANGFAVRLLPDAAVYTTLKNGVAGVLLIGLAVATVRPADVRALDRRAWGVLALIGVVGGSLPFLLFFSGLAQASAPTAAFIHKTLFVWVAVLAVPFLGERLGLAQLAALAVLLAGQTLVAPPTGIAWGPGETMIAAATALWAVEAVMARRLLARASRPVPAQVVGAARLAFGFIVLAGYLVGTGRLAVVAGLSGAQWVAVLGTGLLLSAYVATWFAALRHAPASLVAAVLVVGAPITALLQAAVSGTLPGAAVLGGEALILAGAVALAAAAVRVGPRVTPTGGEPRRSTVPIAG